MNLIDCINEKGNMINLDISNNPAILYEMAGLLYETPCKVVHNLQRA